MMRRGKHYKIILLIIATFVFGLITGIVVTKLFPNLWEPPFQNAMIQFPTGSLSNIKSDELRGNVLRTVGSESDVIYIAEGTPSVTLDANGELKRLSFSVLIPEQKMNGTRYIYYQLRVDEPGDLLIVKCYEVPEPQKKISMDVFWDALSYLPIDYVRDQAGSEPDQYLLTIFWDQVIDDSQYPKAHILHYNQNGLTAGDSSGGIVSCIITPMFAQSEGGYHGVGSDSYMVYYCN